MAKTKLMAQKAELEKEHRGAAAFDSRLAELDMALEPVSYTHLDVYKRQVTAPTEMGIKQ